MIEKEVSKFLVWFGLGKLYISKTKKEATIKLLVSILIIYISYLGLLSTIYNSENGKFIVLMFSMFGIFTGAIIITSALFKIAFNLQAVDEEGNTISDELQKTDSMPLIIYWVCIIAIVALPLKGCSDEQSRYADEQLRLYGKTIKIKISEIYKPPKSSKRARFQFKHNGERIEEDLLARDFKDGDEALVTYSTENPNIIFWTDERQKKLSDELRDSYKWQRIIINDIFNHPKLGKRAKFTYENYGDYFESHLPAKNYKIGDTVKIIFSKDNTNIMGWSYNEATAY